MLSLKTSCKVSPMNKVLGMRFNRIPSLYSWLPNYLSLLTRSQNISSIIGRLGWPLPSLRPPLSQSSSPSSLPPFHLPPHLLCASSWPGHCPGSGLSISWVFAIRGWYTAWFCCQWNIHNMGSIPGSGSWSRKWQPTPVFLLGESHGQRSLVDYSPWGCKELDTTQNRLALQSYTGIASIILSKQVVPLHCLKLSIV